MRFRNCTVAAARYASKAATLKSLRSEQAPRSVGGQVTSGIHCDSYSWTVAHNFSKTRSETVRMLSVDGWIASPSRINSSMALATAQ